MENMLNDNDATYLSPSLWQKPDQGGVRYTSLKQWPGNIAGHVVSLSGGVSDEGKYTYAILVYAGEKNELEPFSIVAEWDILAGVLPQTLDVIAGIVSKAVGYSAQSILDPDGERAA